MKIQKIFILVVLNIATYLLSYLIFPTLNLTGLLILFVNAVLVSTLFCSHIKRLAESSLISKKRKEIVAWSSILAMIVIDVVAYIVAPGNIIGYFAILKSIWWLISGIWALLSYHLDKPSGDKRAVKILIWIFSGISLVLNAFLFFPYAPWYESIIYGVIFILPFVLAFVSISSYHVARTLTGPRKWENLLFWIVLSSASFGFGWRFPELLPFWIPIPVISCLVGMARNGWHFTINSKLYKVLKIILYCLLAASVVMFVRVVVVSCTYAFTDDKYTYVSPVMAVPYMIFAFSPLPVAFIDALYCLRYFASDKKTIVKTVANCFCILLSIMMLIEISSHFVTTYYKYKGPLLSSAFLVYLTLRAVYIAAARIKGKSA